MARPTYDPLRALAIGTQAAGLTAIIVLETALGDAARPWQGLTLGLMVAAALGVATVRFYRHQRALREREKGRAGHREEDAD